MKKRRPASPVISGLITAAIAFVLPVVVGLVTGDMSGREFGYIVLLTGAAFAVGYVAAVVQRRRPS